MPDDACQEFEAQLQTAIQTLKALQAEGQTPNDLSSTYYKSFGQMEAAKSRYRAAVRGLAECRATHQPVKPEA
jgi:hypothetical protein